MKLPDVNICLALTKIVDAWLAAFAMASCFEMVTTDKAFKQFKGLQLWLLQIGK